MKNIHILPTDNYSPLVHSTNKYGGYFKSEHYSPMKEMGDSYQNIYITSDEETLSNNGDYYLGHPNYNTIHKWNMIGMHEGKQVWINKIILTTDPDLIKDGVQSIDDEFLEWFVNNPSCEEVEVCREGYKKNGMIDEATSYQYKIIIPKEEPKQETLEEVAERLAKDAYKKHSVKDDKLSLDEQIQRSGGFIVGFKEGMIEGAKWQQERMYTEEEVLDMMFELLNEKKEECCITNTRDSIVRKVFEQFQKK